MGMLDQLKNAEEGVVGILGGENREITSALMQMFTHNEQGGLQGIIQSFQQKGLGNIIQSWMGKGQKQPVTKEQIKIGMGEERMQNIATKTGHSPDTVASRLQEVLPEMVSKLTPDGKVPEGNTLQQAINSIKEKL